MRHRAALAWACVLIAGPGPAATVGIAQNDPAGTADGGGTAVPQTSNGEPKLSLDDRQSGSGDPVTVSDVANGGSERDGNSLGPEAVAVKESGGFDDNAPNAVSSAAGPEPSALTRLLMVFADLRATVFGGP